MNDQGLKDLFRGSGALLSGHFRLSSGLHSDQYFQCALLLCEPRTAGLLGDALGKLAQGEPWRPDVVVSPALGGVVIGHETARALGLKALFAERDPEGGLELRRGFSLRPGQRVLIVEDVVTTGRSTKETIALVRSFGADPVGALAIVLRGEAEPELGVPFRSLAHWPARAFERRSCPLCSEGKPVEKPGSRPGAPL
jgi:orotate phosphoribosyltransferase